ncbi:MAG: hypothetical protein AB7N80_06450 [Bdellovibrionales bacterium]
MKYTMLVILTFLSWPSFANGVGNGGDELRFLFQEGRGHAIHKIAALKRCSFEAAESEELVDWILQRKYVLMADVENSPHEWITDAQSTCAFTQTKSQHPITLSFEACKNILTKEQAGRLLIHESVHHMGVSSESFADEVAYAIYGASNRDVCPEPTDDPFESSSCTGSPMSEEAALAYIPRGEIESAEIAAMSMHSRYRVCQAQTGCTAWREGAEFGFLYPVTSCTGCGNDPQTGYRNFMANQAKSKNTLNFRIGLKGKIILDLDQTQPSESWPPTAYSWRFISRSMDHRREISVSEHFYDAYYGSGQLVLGGHNELGEYRSSSERNKQYLAPLRGKLTDHCLRLTTSNRVQLPDGRWVENQGVLFSRFEGK